MNDPIYLTRHKRDDGTGWALDGKGLPAWFSLSELLAKDVDEIYRFLSEVTRSAPVSENLLPPIEADQEVWACGVTYWRSREARMEESDVADVYERVYNAERPEIFFKGLGWRTRGDQEEIRIRRDSDWNVPEPELTLVLNHQGHIVGYTVGNDVSSRSIEGENPLYLPQAKTYDGSCAIGPGILFSPALGLSQMPIKLQIERKGGTVFAGEANTDLMKRNPQELAKWAFRELAFPHGLFLMTGTCLVPGDDFTLLPGDRVRIEVGSLSLVNVVAD